MISGTRHAEAENYPADIVVTVASTHVEFNFISEIAQNHPFGERKAFLPLVARFQGTLQGALLAEPTNASSVTPSVPYRLFGDAYAEIQRNAVTVVRIYTPTSVYNKFLVHHALIERAMALAPALVPGRLTLIDGVSYDYHPLALPCGFHVVVPRQPDSYFYYWKPVHLPSGLHVKELGKQAVKHDVRQILEARRNMQYWMAPGPDTLIARAVANNVWAIRKTTVNNGRWRSLKRGDLVILVGRGGVVRALGTVDRTEIRKTREYADFPLWILFQSPVLGGLSIPLPEAARSIQDERGGLVSVNAEVATEILRRAKAAPREAASDAVEAVESPSVTAVMSSKPHASLEPLDGVNALADSSPSRRDQPGMWIRPHPLLLRQLSFVVTAKQVCVVQSFALVSTVYQYLKEILEERGWRVTFAGEIAGTIVFETIWKMLNESEAVLVDFTDRRPNVYLEYGMALVLGKPIISITQSAEDIPSDTPNLKYLLYENTLRGFEQLRNRLPNAVSEVIKETENLRYEH